MHRLKPIDVLVSVHIKHLGMCALMMVFVRYNQKVSISLGFIYGAVVKLEWTVLPAAVLVCVCVLFTQQIIVHSGQVCVEAQTLFLSPGSPVCQMNR